MEVGREEESCSYHHLSSLQEPSFCFILSILIVQNAGQLFVVSQPTKGFETTHWNVWVTNNSQAGGSRREGEIVSERKEVELNMAVLESASGVTGAKSSECNLNHA